MADTLKKKTPTSFYIKMLIFTALVLGVGYLPPVAGITVEGMKLVGLFVGLLFGTILLDSMVYPALIVMFLYVAMGFKTSGAALTAWIGNPTICTMIAFLALTDGIRSSGAAEVIAKWIITRKAFQGKPYVFSYIFLFAAFIAGIFLPPTAGMIFFMQIFDSCRKVIGYEAKDNYCKWMIVGVSLACCFGTYALPFKSMCVAIMAPFLGIIGMEVNTAKFILITYSISLVFMALYVFLMKLNKVNFAPIEDFDANNVTELQGEMKLNKKQIIIIIAFVIAVFYSFLPLIIKTGEFITWVKKWGLAIWVLFVDALLNVFRIDGEPIMNVEKALKDGVMWRIVAIVGVLTMVSDSLNMPEYGVQPLLTNFMNSVFGGMGFLPFTIIIVLFLIVATNFLANQALGMVCGTVIAPIAMNFMKNGIDYNVFCVMIAFCVQAAFMTPAGYVTVPIFMGGETMNGEQSFLFKKGWQILLTFLVPAVFFLVLYGNIL